MGNGTLITPFTLAQALSSGEIVAGHHVYLRGGNYTQFPYTVTHAGNATASIKLKPYNNERAIVRGGMSVQASYLEFRGLEFAKQTYSPRNESDGACDSTTWLDVYNCHDVKFINCIIHDFSYGSESGQANIEYNGCVIYHTGWEMAGYTAGHGLYLGNTDQTKTVTVKNCVIFDTFGFGIHAYTTNADAWNIDLNGNIVFNAGALTSWGGRRTNILLGCVMAGMPRSGKIRNNCTYFPDLTGGCGIQLGFGAAGSNNCQVTNNYIAGGSVALSIRNPSGSTVVTDNIVMGALQYFVSTDYPSNTYLSAFPNSGNYIRVYPSDYQTDRATIAVYNWDLATSVIVDLSSVTGLGAGDVIMCRNVQDYFTDIQFLTLDSHKRVTVNMQATNRTVATPLNWTAPATTFPQFGAFVIEKQA